MDYLASVTKSLSLANAASSSSPAAADSRAESDSQIANADILLDSQGTDGNLSNGSRAIDSPSASLAENDPQIDDVDDDDDDDSDGPDDLDSDRNPPMGFTENNSLTYKATGNPCLDFFFHVVPNTPPDDLIRRLGSAWRFDALTTLKLVCNLRGVRGTGKSDKEGWYTSALWLHKHHPKTLASNLRAFANFGYFKDLLEILYRLVEGSDVRKIAKQEWRKQKGSGIRKRQRMKQLILREAKAKARSEKYIAKKELSEEMDMDLYYMDGDEDDDDDEETARALQWEREIIAKSKKASEKFMPNLWWRQTKFVSKQRNPLDSYVREVVTPYRGTAIVEKLLADKKEMVVPVDKETARVLRKKREVAKAKKASDKYMSDSSYRSLHDQVADLFAGILTLDVKYLNAGEPNKISLASKWCPSMDSSYDKATLIFKSIATRVFSKEPEYAGVDEVTYVYKVRNRLRKEVLVPLRKALQLPEVYMSAKRWGLLPYTRVASVAMNKYKSIFKKHDEERFNGYLEDVKSGKAKIAAGALLPHQIIASLEEQDGEEVAELQWARTVDDLLKKGKLRNCMAICDVSGSMYGTPLEVCVALGLLVSELSDDPWKGKLITFSANPQFHQIEGDSLKFKTEFIRRMEWGMNTDFQKVFDKILRVAVEEKLSEDQMIKRLFVFSDMEFDQASRQRTSYSCPCSSCTPLSLEPQKTNGWETDYQAIQRKFKKHGYNKVPEIVFWNLRDSSSTPVVANQPGVALLSGFSKNLLSMFLDGDGIVSPVDVMQLAISGEEYKELVVVD